LHFGPAHGQAGWDFGELDPTRTVRPDLPAVTAAVCP
jgi:hypothetical protein